jgi:hypothetical protein
MLVTGAKSRVKPVSLALLQSIASDATELERLVVRAGTPEKMPAPSGVADILKRGGTHTLGFSGGLTLVQSASAFTPPTFATTRSHQRIGPKVEHYAIVRRTSSGDATHDSFYPAPGEHLRPRMEQKIGGRTYLHYWLISREIAEMIEQGEQEHLDDAARAYELTYKKIETEINALAAAKPFGPAATPDEAEKMAEAALKDRLPKELGTDPGNWVKVLDKLLVQTRQRDTEGWHSLTVDPPQTVGQKILHPVATTSKTRIGQVPSSQVVNY